MQVNRAAGVGSSIASGLETLVSIKSVFARKNKAVASGAGDEEAAAAAEEVGGAQPAATAAETGI
eukprot:COSAG05_NODE_4995_length_1299_cov_4.111667_1_plen_65_part_00